MCRRLRNVTILTSKLKSGWRSILSTNLRVHVTLLQSTSQVTIFKSIFLIVLIKYKCCQYHCVCSCSHATLAFDFTSSTFDDFCTTSANSDSIDVRDNVDYKWQDMQRSLGGAKGTIHWAVLQQGELREAPADKPLQMHQNTCIPL